MLCQKCNLNQANTVFTQTINGKTTTGHICSDCARESGDIFNRQLRSMLADFGGMSLPFQGFMPMQSIFSKIFSPCVISSGNSECECDLDRVKRTDIQKTAEQNNPGQSTSLYTEIATLRAKLNQSIKEERFEDAAKYRDEIKALEQDNG